jgi:hypothetical protein
MARGGVLAGARGSRGAGLASATLCELWGLRFGRGPVRCVRPSTGRTDVDGLWGLTGQGSWTLCGLRGLGSWIRSSGRLERTQWTGPEAGSSAGLMGLHTFWGLEPNGRRVPWARARSLGS